MPTKITTLSTVLFAFVLNVLIGTNAFAIHAPGHVPMYDEDAYTNKLDAKMKKLDKLYLQAIDKNLSQGKVLQAKREYFKVARELLQSMNERFDKLDPKKGAALSHTEMLMINHIQVMLLDMLTSIHEGQWNAGDKVY